MYSSTPAIISPVARKELGPDIENVVIQFYYWTFVIIILTFYIVEQETISDHSYLTFV